MRSAGDHVVQSRKLIEAAYLMLARTRPYPSDPIGPTVSGRGRPPSCALNEAHFEPATVPSAALAGAGAHRLTPPAQASDLAKIVRVRK